MFTISRKKKCSVCNSKIKGDPAEIRLDTADGVLNMEICETCADNFEKLQSLMMERSNAKFDRIPKLDQPE